MAYIIYQTDALVLSKRNFGEAEQYISFYTSDLGGVRAIAKGVRLLKSKLRYTLDNLSFVRVGLVRGKDVWRVVDSQELGAFKNIKESKEKLKIFSKIINLLNKLIVGEEKNRELWQVLESGLRFLNDTSLDVNMLKSFEIIMVLRILNNLGYLKENDRLESFLGSDWGEDILMSIESHKKEALAEINNSLLASQL